MKFIKIRELRKALKEVETYGGCQELEFYSNKEEYYFRVEDRELNGENGRIVVTQTDRKTGDYTPYMIPKEVLKKSKKDFIQYLCNSEFYALTFPVFE